MGHAGKQLQLDKKNANLPTFRPCETPATCKATQESRVKIDGCHTPIAAVNKHEHQQLGSRWGSLTSCAASLAKLRNSRCRTLTVRGPRTLQKRSNRICL